MWYRIKLVEVELVIGANVDVGSFVFSTVAIFGGRKYCCRVSFEGMKWDIASYQ